MTRTPHKNLVPVNLFILSPLYLFFSVLSTSGDSPPRYIPTENIAVDCGALTNSTEPNGRNWVADIDSKQFTLKQPKNNASVTSAAQKPSVSTTVPYSTARISTSKFTYVFRLTAGHKFIRLYFNPSSYQNFESSKAFFSVKANQFTLLSNTSGYFPANQFTLLSNTSGYFPETNKKEFCITVEEDEDQTLSLTFAPSAHSYAFINGIEIVSMPANLYYVSATELKGFSFVGYPEKVYILENSTALETIHRLNVGGGSISPHEDTGLFRTWSQDHEYVSIAGALPVNLSAELRFTKIPNYSAPDLVYKTARSMGNGKYTNEHYNLTWALPVDSGFTYMVRLHFCEFQPNITKGSDREFRIFMENQTAEEYADVISWSGGNGIPVYRDYAVQVLSSKTEKKQNLSIALHPGSEKRTRYSDAILNGLEVFKLSDFNRNLAGPNAVPTLPPAAPSITPPTKGENKQTTALATTICGGVVLLSVITGLLIFRRRRSWWRSLPYIALRTTRTGGSSLPSAVCRRLSLAEIRAATNNFDGVFIVGRGGFGDVYKGYFDGGATAVAIKRLKPGSKQGAHEFSTEIEMLSQLRHLHLVSLVGYCNEGHEMILIYDYVSRGSLRDHLYKTCNPHLSWNQRLQICIGAAKGLHYLHAGATRMIIHRDVKTTNILLDDKWVAKVSDFGLSKTNPNNIPDTQISTAVKGSFGYLDPEYYRRQQLTEKSDVYSFGVVLFEVLCARLPLDKTLEREQVGLAAWAQLCYHKGTLDQIVDPHLKGKIAPECLKKFGEIAVSCLHDEGIQRPSMNDVVWALEFALQLQESAGEIIKLRGSQKEFNDNTALLFNGEDAERIGDGHASSNGVTLMTTSDRSLTSSGCTDDRVSSDAVFSEILETRAR